MSFEPLRASERADLLRRAGDLLEKRDAALAREDLDRSAALLDQHDALIELYFSRLPVVATSCCPYCERPYMRSFDPFGFDGPWWAPDAERFAPPPCPHFCCIRGAIRFGADEPRAGKLDVYTGPEAPYVIPRLLAFPGMIAVVGELRMEAGWPVYTIGYFAQRRPPVEKLAADWPGREHTYETALGERGFEIDNELWSFDLRLWLELGRLCWCEPGSANERIAAGRPADCPYLDLPGRGEMLVVTEDGIVSRGVPDGTPVSPYED